MLASSGTPMPPQGVVMLPLGAVMPSSSETGLMELCVVGDAGAAAEGFLCRRAKSGVSWTLMPPQGVVMPPLGDVMELVPNRMPLGST